MKIEFDTSEITDVEAEWLLNIITTILNGNDK